MNQAARASINSYIAKNRERKKWRPGYYRVLLGGGTLKFNPEKNNYNFDISGMVVDGAGQPVRDVNVRLRPPIPSEVDGALPDRDSREPWCFGAFEKLLRIVKHPAIEEKPTWNKEQRGYVYKGQLVTDQKAADILKTLYEAAVFQAAESLKTDGDVFSGHLVTVKFTTNETTGYTGPGMFADSFYSGDWHPNPGAKLSLLTDEAAMFETEETMTAEEVGQILAAQAAASAAASL